MGRRPEGKQAMTDAHRAKRYRENKKPTSAISRQRRRAERVAALAAATARAWELLDEPDRLFPVLYVDFPWRVERWSGQPGLLRTADHHYPTMTVDEIKAAMSRLPATEDCVLFMWTVSELLHETKEILAAGDFEYRSNCVWQKARAGTGRWFRFKHEILVVAVRGDIPAPAPGENWESVIEAPWQGHSRKPEIFAEMIAAYYPSCPKLEMFYRALDDPEAERVRREKREAAGWYAWGNEVEQAAAQSA
jgi:N6-adenosine-specific RNA methylase IME4